MKRIQKQQKKKKGPTKSESNLGLNKKMLGNFVSKKQANIMKGKGQ